MWDKIKRQLINEGPVHAWLSEEEYLYLKKHFRKIWLNTGHSSPRWGEEDRLIALGYLRGYTLYREVPENENMFWGPFLEELGVEPGQPGKYRFNALWSALNSHPDTKPHIVVRNGRRMLAQTIDRIWGVRGLRAAALGELLNYYLDRKESKKEPELENWLRHHNEYAYVAHHAGTYERIFNGLYLMLNTARKEPELVWDYLLGKIDDSAFINELQSMGLLFSKPHPMAYIKNKSERLFRELLVKYVSVSEAKSRPVKGAKKSGRSTPAQRIKVRFAPADNLNLTGLDGLEIVPDIKYRTVLLEGRIVTGEARLSSGRLAPQRFQWRPRLDEQGEPVWVRPEGEGVVLGFGENEIRINFELLPTNVIHLELSGFERVLNWNVDNLHVAVKGARASNLRYQMDSDDYESKHWKDLNPLAKDQLQIKYSTRNGVFLVEKVPVRYVPVLDSWQASRSPHGVEVSAMARVPRDGGVVFRVKTSGGVEEKVLQQSSESEYAARFDVDPLEPVEVEIELFPDGPKESINIPLEVDWGKALRTGIGIGLMPTESK